MSMPSKLPPTGKVDELDYEQMCNYKFEIFKTIWPEHINLLALDSVSDKVLNVIDKIYDNLTKSYGKGTI